ncbi:hypothetical protein [Oscillatoria acuminata]|uniref:hypothetical protein n=1 Tax=Oscillatoria acuminata TaxID=118323 RepID=UPI0003056BFA|nr:hypothetical protein [Oscillatoria acuminata]
MNLNLGTAEARSLAIALRGIQLGLGDSLMFLNPRDKTRVQRLLSCLYFNPYVNLLSNPGASASGFASTTDCMSGNLVDLSRQFSLGLEHGIQTQARFRSS